MSNLILSCVAMVLASVSIGLACYAKGRFDCFFDCILKKYIEK